MLTTAARWLLAGSVFAAGVTASTVPAVAAGVGLALAVVALVAWLGHVGFLRGWLEVRTTPSAPAVRPPRR